MVNLDGPKSNDSPPFSLTQPKYDPSTFVNRWLNMLNIIDPRTLFVSREELNRCEELLEEYKKNPNGKFNNEELWKARKIKEAIKNPDSGEIIPMPFRMSGFVPFGVPIVVGMLLPNPSLPTTLFFQWLNQTHNALVNYYNRPILPGVPTNTRRLVEAYVGAVTSALGVSAGLQYLFRNSTSFIKNFVPFFAVASANICNVTLMRRDELTNGIEIKNQKGEVVGISQVAAKKALFETALTRVALPLPLLTFPPLIMGYLNQMNWLKTRPFLQLPIQTAICTAAFGFALPIAIALFPQYGTIPGHKLEQDRFAKYSQDTLIYNKGL